MTRPVVASIDLLALRQNLQIVRRAAPGSRLWAVVKANAYGHGVARVWSALSAADGFALLNLEEAILLREQGWKGPILLLEGFFHADELAVLDQYRLTTSVHSNWQIKALQQAKLRAPLDIYLKVNSGMNRLGFMPERVHTVWIGVQNLRPGEAIGYGGLYRTTQEQRIGIVACGYADGYPRVAPSGTPVLVDGVRTTTVGRVSMDMLAVDLTPCPQAGIGAPVELWGKEIKIDDVAASSGTVGYELMCALAPRVPVVTL